MGRSLDTVTQAYECFRRGDIPGLLDLLADDVEWTSPKTLPQGGSFHGKDGVGQFFQGVGAAWSALEIKRESLDEVDGDVVIGVVRGDGTLQGGGSASYGAAHVFQVRDGKIAGFRELVDVDEPITK
jgi:uncharacterized protein